MRSATIAVKVTGAFGRLFALWLCGAGAVLAAPCDAPPGLAAATVQRVVDGDTLRLADGERVRMVGLDAPELGRDGAPDQPLAAAATAHLKTLVGLADSRVLLRVGAEPRDRHGRLLAIVYSERHGDLAAHLLRNGLARTAPIPPNLAALACHQQAERAARDAAAGLWAPGGGAVTAAATLDRTGFAVVRGTSGAWRVRRDDRLLMLDDALVLRVRDADAARWFEGVDLEAFAGQRLEVRGWVHPWREGRRAITVQHPAAIEVVGD